jgi:hypothetical protein
LFANNSKFFKILNCQTTLEYAKHILTDLEKHRFSSHSDKIKIEISLIYNMINKTKEQNEL